MPIIPLLADDIKTIETLVKWASESGASYLMTGMLYLTGGIRKTYFEFLEKNYPENIEEYKKLYPKGGANKDYKTSIHQEFAKYRKIYGVKTWYELIKEGFVVYEASNGQEALDILENKMITLAIIDIMVPKIDGWQNCELIRN
jgi:CheY-like chemotaxis protein